MGNVETPDGMLAYWMAWHRAAAGEMPTGHRAGVMADYLQGYQSVPDSGTKVPSPCGTEEANEGKASGGNKWAKRKFSPGPVEGPGKSGE